MSVYPSIHHCDQHISLQDFVERIVMQPRGRWYSHPGPPISSEEQHDDRDADPCPPEDEECFDAPVAASMEEAISKFGSEAQERSGFDDIHRLLKRLPVPVWPRNKGNPRHDAGQQCLRG